MPRVMGSLLKNLHQMDAERRKAQKEFPRLVSETKDAGRSARDDSEMMRHGNEPKMSLAERSTHELIYMQSIAPYHYDRLQRKRGDIDLDYFLPSTHCLMWLAGDVHL
jgi:hypothetical protein